MDADVRYYRPDWKDQLVEDLVGWCDGYISRVNPGNLPGGEADYFDFLRQLSEAGMVGMSHPDQMLTFGAKDALVKLADTDLVPDDTYAYYDVETLHSTFPTSLSYGERVLKQNRGSTGRGSGVCRWWIPRPPLARHSRSTPSFAAPKPWTTIRTISCSATF